jgi:hypothetical protein
MTATLTTPGYIHGMTHIGDAKTLRANVEAAGGAMSASLLHLLAAHELLSVAPGATDHSAPIIAAAVAGDLTAAKLNKLVGEAAVAEAAAQLRSNLARRASGDIVRQFGAELVGGAADEIVASLRPQFDDAAKRIEDALQIVRLDLDYARFVDEASPEALGAYQGLKSAVAVIDRVLAIAVQFGPRSTSFPLIMHPTEGGVYDDFVNVEDAALFVTPPGSPIAGWTSRLRDHRAAVASQQSIKPRDLGLKFSPWLSGGLRLNTISEACELVRVFAETVADNNVTPGLVGRVVNPYRAEAAGDVEVFGPDGSVAEVV